MKQIFAMLFAVVVFIVAVAAEAATLRPEAVIDGGQVTLGDLFDGLPPDQAATAIARAPALGRSVTLDARWLSRLARAHGIAWDMSVPPLRTTVSRPSHRLDSVLITATVRDALADRMAGDRFELAFDNRSLEAHLPIDAEPTMALEGLTVDPVSGRFAGMLVAPATGTPEVRLAIAGRATRILEVPVLLNRLRPGDVISEADIAIVDMPAQRVAADIALDIADMVGLSPRRLLSANVPVRLSDLRAPIVVHRGEAVTMLLNNGALTISARGKALEDGARNTLVRVVNIDSNRTIEAEIVGPGTVVVRGFSAIAAVN